MLLIAEAVDEGDGVVGGFGHSRHFCILDILQQPHCHAMLGMLPTTEKPKGQ